MKDFKDYLKMIPELIESTSNLTETVKDHISVADEIMHSHVNAVIGNDELAKIENTKCAMPDASDICHLICDGVREDLSQSISSSVSKSVRETIEKQHVKTESVHTYVTPWELTKMIDKKARNWIYTLATCCAIMVLGFIGIGFGFYNGEKYYGSQYVDICRSEYISDDERKSLMDDTYYVAILPQEFNENKQAVKQKIKRFKEVVEEREHEARRTRNQ